MITKHELIANLTAFIPTVKYYFGILQLLQVEECTAALIKC